MSPALVCKKCRDYVEARHWCLAKGIFRTPWDDMCEAGLLKHKERVANNELAH